MNKNDTAALRTYGLVYVALLILLVLTVAAARWNLGDWNIGIALLIAVSKAVLIMMFFMHLTHRSTLIILMATAGFFWLIMMLMLTLADYSTRSWLS